MAENVDTMDALDQPIQKKSPVMVIIMLVNLLLVGGVLAFLFLRDDGKKDEAAKATAGAEAAAPGAIAGPREPGPIMSFDNFIVNLADQDVNRYLKVAMSLELASEEFIETIRKRQPLIRDAIITMMSSLTYQEIRTSKGKDALKTEIGRRLAELLGPGQVLAVYFTEFVVQ